MSLKVVIMVARHIHILIGLYGNVYLKLRAIEADMVFLCHYDYFVLLQSN